MSQSRLDTALTVEGFTTTRDAHRVVFESTDSDQIVIWRIGVAELNRHAMQLKRGTRGAFGTHASGEHLLAVHVHAAVATFEGRRGEMRLVDGSLRVESIA